MNRFQKTIRWLTALSALMMSAATVPLFATSPPGCVAINQKEWSYYPFGAEQTASNFTARVTVTPKDNNDDIVISIAKERASALPLLSVSVRLGMSGYIEPFSGTAYLRSSVPYQAGVPVVLRFVVDIPNHRYSVYAAGVGSNSETVVGTNLSFRSSAGSPMILGSWVLTSDSGSARACGFAAPSWTVVGGTGWSNNVFLPQTGFLAYEWDATPLVKPVDTVFGLSTQTPVTDFPQLACSVRFSSLNRVIQALNGTQYSATTYIPYSAGVMYHFRLRVDVLRHKYSVYVTPAGGTEQALAVDFFFRDGQTATTALTNFAAVTDSPNTGAGATLTENFRLTEFQDTFTGPSGLITDANAADNPSPFLSPEWIASNGALYIQQNIGHENDALFRMHSKPSIEGNYRISFALRINNIAAGVSWNGVHLFMRHLSQFDLYYVSVARADGKVVIKRKVPCASASNDGMYVELSDYVPFPSSAGIWRHFSATIETNADGTVIIKLFNDETGALIVQGIDRGGWNSSWSGGCIAGRYPSQQYPPIPSGGAVGIRGDNASIDIDNFKVIAF